LLAPVAPASYLLSLHDALPILILALNTLFWCWPLFALSLLKLLLPFAPIQRALRFAMHWIAETWISINRFWMDLVQPTRWDVQGDRKSTRLNSSHVKISYAVVC